MVSKRVIYEKLVKLQHVLNEYHSQIPEIETGRQNILSDIENEVGLDELVEEMKKDLKI